MLALVTMASCESPLPLQAVPSLRAESLAMVPENAANMSINDSSPSSPLSLPCLTRRGVFATDSPTLAQPTRLDEADRFLKRSNSKSVRFSNSTDNDDDEDEFPGFMKSMSEEGGKQWKSLGEFAALKVTPRSLRALPPANVRGGLPHRS